MGMDMYGLRDTHSEVDEWPTPKVNRMVVKHPHTHMHTHIFILKI